MKTDNPTRRVLLWVVSLALAALFLFSGINKLAGAEQMVTTFRRWGYPEGFYFLVGLVEVAGALLLLFPRTAALGATALIVVMIGAVITHLVYDDAVMALVPLALLVLLCLVAYARRAALSDLVGAFGGRRRRAEL